MGSVPTRRERLRSATVAEIKDVARRLLVAGGPASVSLRAIAREMGMTAPAIYRYFPSLDALVLELTEGLYDELSEVVEAARNTAPPDDPIAQLVGMARSFRRWSVTHPTEFGLMFGTPVPEVAIGTDAIAAGHCADGDHAGARFGAPFLQTLHQLWQQTPFPTPPPEVIQAQLGPCLAAQRAIGRSTDMPVEIIYTYLSAWTRLYGMVALEVFGHLRWAVTTVEPLFEVELAAFVAQMTTHIR